MLSQSHRETYGSCRQGVIPLDTTSDTAGPIARTVSDVATLLGAMAGYDMGDALTGLALSNEPPANYTQFLATSLKVLPFRQTDKWVAEKAEQGVWQRQLQQGHADAMQPTADSQLHPAAYQLLRCCGRV